MACVATGGQPALQADVGADQGLEDEPAAAGESFEEIWPSHANFADAMSTSFHLDLHVPVTGGPQSATEWKRTRSHQGAHCPCPYRCQLVPLQAWAKWALKRIWNACMHLCDPCQFCYLEILQLCGHSGGQPFLMVPHAQRGRGWSQKRAGLQQGHHRQRSVRERHHAVQVHSSHVDSKHTCCIKL